MQTIHHMSGSSTSLLEHQGLFHHHWRSSMSVCRRAFEKQTMSSNPDKLWGRKGGGGGAMSPIFNSLIKHTFASSISKLVMLSIAALYVSLDIEGLMRVSADIITCFIYRKQYWQVKTHPLDWLGHSLVPGKRHLHMLLVSELLDHSVPPVFVAMWI